MSFHVTELLLVFKIDFPFRQNQKSVQACPLNQDSLLQATRKDGIVFDTVCLMTDGYLYLHFVWNSFDLQTWTVSF